MHSTTPFFTVERVVAFERAFLTRIANSLLDCSCEPRCEQGRCVRGNPVACSQWQRSDDEARRTNLRPRLSRGFTYTARRGDDDAPAFERRRCFGRDCGGWKLFIQQPRFKAVQPCGVEKGFCGAVLRREQAEQRPGRKSADCAGFAARRHRFSLHPEPAIAEMASAALAQLHPDLRRNLGFEDGRFSLDGSEFAFGVTNIRSGASDEIWVYDLRRERLRRVADRPGP
jgi:hypothetical protein